MEPPISPVLFSILLVLSMLIMLEGGRRLAVRRRSKEVDGQRSNLGGRRCGVCPFRFADGVYFFESSIAV